MKPNKTDGEISIEKAVELLQAKEKENMIKAQKEIAEVCKKYNVNLIPQITIDIVPAKKNLKRA